MAQISTSELLILEDGSSVHITTILADTSCELRDGASGTIDFSDSGLAWTDSLSLEGV